MLEDNELYQLKIKGSNDKSDHFKDDNSKKIFWNKLCYYLISFYAGISSITELAVSYYFKDTLLVGPAKVSQLMTAIALPWSLKPLLGLVTDCLPIFGYKRKFYILLCGIFASLCWYFMSTEPTLGNTVFFLVIINICSAFSSILGEAVVVDLAKNVTTASSEDEKSTNAKDYISLFMIFKYFGMLFASFMKGKLVETIGLKQVFIIGSTLPILIIIAGLIMIDTKIKPKKPEQFEQVGLSDEERRSIVQTNNPNQTGSEENHTPSMKEMYLFVTQKRILLPMIFIILFMSTPSYSDPFFYYLTNELKFSATSLGQISFWSTIGVLLGIFLYKQFFKDAKFKSVLIICTLLSFIFTFFAYILVLRLNIRYGIQDYVIVLFSNSILSMLGEIMLLPLLSLACVLCPKNMEGTIFSVFMSALNFGGALSTLLGSFITSYLNITSTDFTNLHSLILIANVTSLLPLILIFVISQKYFEH